jgi:phosphonate transport system substrate-binding protein
LRPDDVSRTEDPEAGPPAEAPGRRPPRPAISLLLLAILLGGATWGALALPPVGGEAEAVEHREAIGIVRDILTGRYTASDGVPLAPEEGWGSKAQPLRLRFVPSTDQAQSGPTIERLLAWLRRRTGFHLEGATLHDYGAVVEEIAQGACDVAFLTATSYARARYRTENNDDPDDDLEAFLQVVRRGSPEYAGSDLAYRAALVVRADSPLESVDDITDETVIFLGPATSGASSVLPSALLNRLGKRPAVQRVRGYHVIVNSVLQGTADVGPVWWSPPNDERPHNDARLTVVESNPDVFEKTRIIGFTAWMPNEPVVIREAIPLALRHTLARALTLYVSLLSLTKEGRAELVSVGGPAGFIPATDDDFLPLMEVIQQAFANDPEGRADFMAGG